MTLAVIALVLIGLSWGLFAVLKRAEERKATVRERERKQELERVMSLTHDLQKRGAQGFNRRVS